MGENRDFMNKTILLILVCFILTIPTKAYSLSGSDFLELCEVSTATCGYYLMGLFEMNNNRLKTNNYIYDSLKDKIQISEKKEDLRNRNKEIVDVIKEVQRIYENCKPNEITIEQTRKMMSKFLEKNPEQLHQPMTFLFPDLLNKNFPCDYSK